MRELTQEEIKMVSAGPTTDTAHAVPEPARVSLGKPAIATFATDPRDHLAGGLAVIPAAPCGLDR
jgi:hypothetical protein